MTCSPYSPEEVTAKIAELKALIAGYDAAILAFALNGAQQSYSIDTGQTRQTVMRASPSVLQATRLSLQNELATFTARYCCGGGVVIARPAF